MTAVWVDDDDVDLLDDFDSAEGVGVSEEQRALIAFFEIAHQLADNNAFVAVG